MRVATQVRTAVVTGAVGVLAAIGVTTAHAAPPDPDAVIDILPGSERAGAMTVTDDAVYFVSSALPIGEYSPTSTLYRRSLTGTPTGHLVGTTTLIGRIVTESSYAVHDGTVAYLRAVDGRLVLRAPNGTETVPAWGDSPLMAAGVVDMSADWLIVNDYPYDPVYTLVDRQTGAMYDLGDLVTAPPGMAPLADSWRIDVEDTRVLWGMYHAGDTWFHGVYTVALGASGPVGAATVLQTGTYPETGPGGWIDPIGLNGAEALWLERQCDTDDCTTLVHRSTAPFSSRTTITLGDVEVVHQFGLGLVTSQMLMGPAERLAWINAATWPAPPNAIVDVPGWSADINGVLVAYYGLDDQEYLADATGANLTGDQTPPPPSMPFSDVGWNDPFTDEILWLYDHGVVGGYADGTFRSQATVNRDAMAAFLYRLAHDGADAPACATAPFVDVPVGHPFCGEITWLATTGITEGYADGTFRPATPVARDAMAAFLYRFAHDGADAPACSTAPFTDVPASHPFCGEIDWMADTGISTGWPDHTFRPSASVERQAMAAFLFRFIDAGLVPTH